MICMLAVDLALDQGKEEDAVPDNNRRVSEARSKLTSVNSSFGLQAPLTSLLSRRTSRHTSTRSASADLVDRICIVVRIAIVVSCFYEYSKLRFAVWDDAA